jgi:hypothetical protein
VDYRPALDAPTLPDYPERGRQKEALQAAGAYLFGEWGWQSMLARRLRRDPRTVRRWVSDQDAVDPTSWELVKAVVLLKSLGVP